MGLRPAGSLPPKAAEKINDKIIQRNEGEPLQTSDIWKSSQNLEICNKIKKGRNAYLEWQILLACLEVACLLLCQQLVQAKPQVE